MNHLNLYEFGEAQKLPFSIQPVALKHYLRQVWQNRHGMYHYADEELLPFENGQPYLYFDDVYVQARNYAGFVHFQGVTIYLFPKLFERRFPAQRQTTSQEMLAHLVFYLSYCRQIQFPFQRQAAQPVDFDPLQHWIHYFASFTESTLSEQPYQTYQTQTNETHYLRGKLAVQSYLNEQVTRGQWQRLQTEQQPFELDNPFNQIVKYTVTRLQTIAKATSQPLLQNIEWLLHEVESKTCTVTDCDAVHLSRLYPKHQEVLDMCRFFLAGEIGGEGSAHAMNFAFLVPMERVFEDFVAGFIQNHFPEWKAEFQKSVRWGMRSDTRPLQVRPDIWLPVQRTVWDTKYKALHLQNGFQPPDSSDLYQLFAYASAYQLTDVHLLYASATQVSSDLICLGNAHQSVNVHIHRLPIVLTSPVDAFSALTLRLKETFQKVVGM